MNEEFKRIPSQRSKFGDLLKFTLSGYAVGLFVGALLDYLDLQRIAMGQWIVRALSGEGESIFEGIYAIRQRLSRAAGSMAEAYGWGKFSGMTAPWIIDWGSRLFGVNVYGVEGFYIPYFYAMSDQIGANVSGMIFLHRKEKEWRKAMAQYVRNGAMITSLAVVMMVPVGLFLARLAGFSPTTQTYTALETVAANLCWAPPLIGWLREGSQRGGWGDENA